MGGCGWFVWLVVVSLVLLILFGWLCYIGLPFGLGDCLVWCVVLINSVGLYVALMVCCV